MNSFIRKYYQKDITVHAKIFFFIKPHLHLRKFIENYLYCTYIISYHDLKIVSTKIKVFFFSPSTNLYKCKPSNNLANIIQFKLQP